MLPPNNGSPSRPGQPTNLCATVVGGSRVDLQWTDNAYNESGFRIERKINGVYTQIATAGANVTRYADTGLSATANTSYRVKAYNSVGDSDYSYVWIYSGWTEVNLINPADLPLYTYYQCSDLRMRGGDFRPDHVTLNNDSNHGPDVTIDVDVSALGSGRELLCLFLLSGQRPLVSAELWREVVQIRKTDPWHDQPDRTVGTDPKPRQRQPAPTLADRGDSFGHAEVRS